MVFSGHFCCCLVTKSCPILLTPWTTAHQASPFLHLSLESVVPFSSCIQSFPASGSFPVIRLFASGGQSIGASASASVLPVISFRIDWFDLLAVQGTLKSLLQHQKHQFFSAQLFLLSSSHIVHDYWRNHSFDYMDLCWQSDVSAFEYTA